MPKVEISYQFNLVAGRNASTCKSIAARAHEYAARFFGSEDFKIEAVVTGRQNDFDVRCMATALIEPTYKEG